MAVDIEAPGVATTEEFERRVVTDMAAALQVAAVVVGDRLGLYAAMADGQPVTAAELAQRTSTHEPFVAAWLAGQAAAEYLAVDPATDRFLLPRSHAPVLLERAGVLSGPGAFQLAAAVTKDEALVTEAFRTGETVAWHEHHPDLFVGYERFFGSAYAPYLTSEWIPALADVEARLRTGAAVVDIGCGRGSTTLLLATSYPQSTFVGCGRHEPSIAAARRRAEEAGLDGPVRFSIATERDVPARSYDLATTFDYLGSVADPAETAAAIRMTLAPAGTWLIVEPRFRAAATEPDADPAAVAVARNMAALLGAPAGGGAPTLGPSDLRAIAREAKFVDVRQVAATALHVVLAARRANQEKEADS